MTLFFVFGLSLYIYFLLAILVHSTASLNREGFTLPLPVIPCENPLSHHDHSHNDPWAVFQGGWRFPLPYSPNCLSFEFFVRTMSPTQFYCVLTLSRYLLLSISHRSLDLTAQKKSHKSPQPPAASGMLTQTISPPS